MLDVGPYPYIFSVFPVAAAQALCKSSQRTLQLMLMQKRVSASHIVYLMCVPQSRGWATGVTAGVDEDGFSSNTCCYLFSIGLTLTEAGLAAGAGCGLAVVDFVFQYFAMMRKEGRCRHSCRWYIHAHRKTDSSILNVTCILILKSMLKDTRSFKSRALRPCQSDEIRHQCVI